MRSDPCRQPSSAQSHDALCRQRQRSWPHVRPRLPPRTVVHRNRGLQAYVIGARLPQRRAQGDRAWKTCHSPETTGRKGTAGGDSFAGTQACGGRCDSDYQSPCERAMLAQLAALSPQVQRVTEGRGLHRRHRRPHLPSHWLPPDGRARFCAAGSRQHTCLQAVMLHVIDPYSGPCSFPAGTPGGYDECSGMTIAQMAARVK